MSIRKVAAMVAAIAITATACNTHSSPAKDQFIDLDRSVYVDNGGYGYHNHWAPSATSVRARFEYQAKASGTNSILHARVCLTWVVARDSDNQVHSSNVNSPKCTSITQMFNPGAFAIEVNHSTAVPAGHTLHAYESTVEVFNYDLAAQQFALITKCEYHDPDGSNNSVFCTGRDANGN